MDLLREAVERSDRGQRLALVTVIRVSGSTPRHPGARMLVSQDGSSIGSIGGGAVEMAVVTSAVEVAGGGQPRRVTHNLVRDLAMCCGGTMELYIEPAWVSRDALARAVDVVEGRGRAVMVTPLAGGPRRIENSEPISAAPSIVGDEFVEPLIPRHRLLLFGCGHIANALGPLARSADFEVVACDDNATGSLEPEPPWASQVVSSFELADAERALGGLGVSDLLVILTRDHAVDERILAQLLPRIHDFGYVGLIGSQGKIGRFRRRLYARGIASDDSWSALRAPIGLDIAAETPIEIAVSVVAELIRLRNLGRTGRS